MGRNSLLERLRDAIVSGDLRKTRKIAEQIILKHTVSAKTTLHKMMEAMEIVDRKYKLNQCSVADVIAAASAMREAFKIFEPHLEVTKVQVKAKIVIGSLKGNQQGLGKDVVASVLRAAGFEVYDIGVDVPPERFVEAAVREKADIIAVSVTVSETAKHLTKLVEELNKKGLRGKVRVVIGGTGVSERTCSEYGLEAYAKDAWDCVKKIERLLAKP